MSGSARVYLGKIMGIGKEELENICRGCGQLVDFLMKDTFAFAEYQTEFDAQKAILELDGRSIKGVRILAEIAKAKGSLDQEYFTQHPRIYVGRIPQRITKAEVTELFQKFGEINDILRKDDYAFIEFKELDAAKNSIRQLHGFLLGGQRLVVEGARPKEAHCQISCPRLYVGKIGPQIKKSDLVGAFACFGEIIDILMKEDYAFIEFATTNSAARALSELNGARVAGSKIVVEEAKPKEGAIDTSSKNKRVPFKNRTNNPDSNPTDAVKIPLKIRGKRLSPRRSQSRSRSRSADNKPSYKRKAYKKIVPKTVV